MNQTRKRRCPACREADLQPATRYREFHPHGQSVRVELLTSKCPRCAALATSPEQHAENLKRLKARKTQYGGLLLGEEILSLRRRYGITQQAAAKIFGKGKIAFSRYENEASYPDESTTLLLTLAIEKPAVIRSLADRAGVELPLWEARCEEDRRDKLYVVSSIKKVDASVNRWAKPAMPMSEQRTVPARAMTRWVHDDLDASTEMVTANDDHFQVREAAFA